jgi:branched-chain amino acid transport system permease protein
VNAPRWHPVALFGLLIAVALSAPLFVPAFALSILSLVFIAALLAASVNMLVGQVGLLSLGQAGIAASAGYAVAWATVNGHPVGVQLTLAALLALMTSAVYGVTTMRTGGIVFLMITLALGMIVYGLVFRLASITGGQNGLTGVARPELLANPAILYLLSVALFALVTAGLRVVGRSPFGLTMRGVRDSESRMASLGYSVASIKFRAVMLSGLIAGIAGVLAVWHAQFVSPAMAAFGRSALAVVMVIVGGTGTLLGPLVGAGVAVGAEHWLSSYVERWSTVLGAVLILVVLYAPRGIVGELAAVPERLARRRMPVRSSPNAAGPPTRRVPVGSGNSPTNEEELE